MPKFTWSRYKKVDNLFFTIGDFRETLDGGQAFTWFELDSTTYSAEYEGVFFDRTLRVAIDSNGEVFISTPRDSPTGALTDFTEYIDAQRDYSPLRKTLAKTKDSNMLRALDVLPTLRILRQNPQEAIICFICSSSKRIVQIKQCVALLSERLGKYAGGGRYALPSFESIANADISVLRECKLGFRAEYLKKTADKIISDSFDPMSLRELPYTEAKKYLCSLSGIGDKVADCILLFGAARFEAFPIDTWIRQAMTNLYGTSSNPVEIRDFALQKFGNNAGFAQQLIFSAIRKNLF